MHMMPMGCPCQTELSKEKLRKHEATAYCHEEKTQQGQVHRKSRDLSFVNTEAYPPPVYSAVYCQLDKKEDDQYNVRCYAGSLNQYQCDEGKQQNAVENNPAFHFHLHLFSPGETLLVHVLLLCLICAIS